MTVSLNQVPRAEKRDIVWKIIDHLKTRTSHGPAEPVLDEYIVELTDIAEALSTHVSGNIAADALRAARLQKLEVADDDVDRWYRHIESYLDVESRRRASPHADEAGALHEAAFADGLAHIDDAIADENRVCRDALAVLRSPEWADSLQAVEFPPTWLEKWDAAVTTSEALVSELQSSRQDKRAHIDSGRDAESDWIEAMVRLRKYVGSRAKKSDTARVQEGEKLLAPLLEVVAKLKAEAKTRATKRSKPAGETPPT